MTYKERELEICRNCLNRSECTYYVRDMSYKCPAHREVMYGWELGQADAFEKISEWLKDFCNEHYIMSYSDSHEVCCSELMEMYLRKMEE